MNINLTLIGQSIAFAVFVWFCLRYIWPPILNALDARRTRIADGLAAAEQGLRAKEEAQVRIDEDLQATKEQAREIISNAQRRADEIVEEAKSDARVEGNKLSTRRRPRSISRSTRHGKRCAARSSRLRSRAPSRC